MIFIYDDEGKFDVTLLYYDYDREYNPLFLFLSCLKAMKEGKPWYWYGIDSDYDWGRGKYWWWNMIPCNCNDDIIMMMMTVEQLQEEYSMPVEEEGRKGDGRVIRVYDRPIEAGI